MLPRTPLALASLAAALVLGCGSDPAPPSNVGGPSGGPGNVPAATNPAGANTKADTATPSSGSIVIDDRILKACGDLPKARFAFDSATIAGEAAAVLDALAKCFTTGPLAGKGMKVVGHADPRGEVEYNLGLGQRRAGGVGDYLASKGVDKAKIEASSKGEFEATGMDEEGWAKDRRVDVLLAD